LAVAANGDVTVTELAGIDDATLLECVKRRLQGTIKNDLIQYDSATPDHATVTLLLAVKNRK
jgi:hypothetical protein